MVFAGLPRLGQVPAVGRHGHLHQSGTCDRAIISAEVKTHEMRQWAVPALPNARTGTNKPNEIHYPHFMSAEIHSDKVDW